jgi:hypothetical protein
MTYMHKASKLMLGIVVTFSMISCQMNQDYVFNETSVREPTPTLFGTAITTPVTSEATSTAIPTKIPDICVFPFLDEATGQNDEAAVYRFDWVLGEESQQIETRGGQITIQGPINLTSGTRRLLIVHHENLPDTLRLSSTLKPESNILYDTNNDTSEIRTEDGLILSQTIHDPTGDIGQLKPALDVTSVERQFAKDDGYIIRLTTSEPNDEVYLSAFENIELLIGRIRYAYRILNSGKIVSLKYDSEGNYSLWDGTLISQGNTITWALNEGASSNFRVKTATDITQADSTVLFEADKMMALWEASLNGCRQ